MEKCIDPQAASLPADISGKDVEIPYDEVRYRERASEPPARLVFVRLRVAAPARTVADGQPIKVGGCAFDMLMALIEAPHPARQPAAYRRASSSAFAALRSAVSKPSVNRS